VQRTPVGAADHDVRAVGESWSLYAWFGGITVISTAGAVLIYWFVNREPWPLSTRIGVGLGGAAAGTFAGALLATGFHVEEPWSEILIITVSVALSVAMQRHLFAWTHDAQL